MKLDTKRRLLVSLILGAFVWVLTCIPAIMLLTQDEAKENAWLVALPPIVGWPITCFFFNFVNVFDGRWAPGGTHRAFWPGWWACYVLMVLSAIVFIAFELRWILS